jgi:hypothetical protein
MKTSELCVRETSLSFVLTFVGTPISSFYEISVLEVIEVKCSLLNVFFLVDRRENFWGSEMMIVPIVTMTRVLLDRCSK